LDRIEHRENPLFRAEWMCARRDLVERHSSSPDICLPCVDYFCPIAVLT